MANEDISCGFCGAAKNEVPEGRLIKGQKSGTYICVNCLEQGHHMMTEAKAKAAAKSRDAFLGKPKDIKAYLDQHIISQERLKVDLSIAVYHHYKRRHNAKAKSSEIELQKSNMLILGGSGTGKTESLRALSKLLKVPFYIQDCTRLTQSGYVGDDTEDTLRGLVEAANGQVEQAEWGIVLLDEFDKLARKSGRGASGYRDVSGEGAQQSLLKMLEGDKMPVTRGRGKNGSITTIGADGTVRSNVDVIDTANILFVAAGSFAGIEEIVGARLNKKARVGFGTSENHRKEFSMTDVYENVTQDDILDFGLIPEVLGRLPLLTSTYELSEEDMVRVLTEPKNAIIKQFKALFDMDEIDLQFDKEALLAIGREAKKRPTGARGLRTIVESSLREVAYDAPSDPSIKGIRITEDTVLGKGKPVILRETSKEKARA